MLKYGVGVSSDGPRLVSYKLNNCQGHSFLPHLTDEHNLMEIRPRVRIVTDLLHTRGGSDCGRRRRVVALEGTVAALCRSRPAECPCSSHASGAWGCLLFLSLLLFPKQLQERCSSGMTLTIIWTAEGTLAEVPCGKRSITSQGFDWSGIDERKLYLQGYGGGEGTQAKEGW